MISTIKLFAKDWTLSEVGEKVLGIDSGGSVKSMGKALIENGHTMTLVQAENMMVKSTRRRAKTGMRVDTHPNFFFVETRSENEPVSLAYMYRLESRWRVEVCSRINLDRRYCSGFRLLVRNLADASKLKII